MEKNSVKRQHPMELTAAFLDAAAAGNPPAFLAFYDLSAPELYGLVLDIVVDREAADRTLLEIFTGIWRGLSQEHWGSRPSFAQVLTNAHRSAVRHLRAGKSGLEIQARLQQMTAAAETARRPAVPPQEPPQSAAAQIAALPPDQRLMIGLLYYSGQLAHEAAAHLGWPENTVRTCTLLAMQAIHAPFSVLLGHSADTSTSPPAEAARAAHPESAAEFLEKAALHALGALEPVEEEAFENHLRQDCAGCREASRAFTDTAAAIGLASTPSNPPAYIKDILAWRLDRDRPAAQPSPPPRRQPEARAEPPLFTEKPQPKGWRRFLPWLS